MSRPKGGEGVSTACQMCYVKFISNDLISYIWSGQLQGISIG